MESEHSNLWFMPFHEDSSTDNQNLEPSDRSHYSSISASPHLAEYDLQSSTFFKQPIATGKECDSPLSPTDVLTDEIWAPSRRDSINSITAGSDKTQTSSKRRAQNRAAQRAFRDRKEKRTKELEEELNSMSEKYRDLENGYNQLQESYDKLQQTLELLTCDDNDGRTSGQQLRKFLEIIQGKARSRLKPEV